MKALVEIKNPTGFIFEDVLDIKQGLNRAVRIKRIKGGWPLKVNIRLPALCHALGIYTSGRGPNICFEANGPLKKGMVLKVTGREFFSRKFTSWTCRFQKIEN